MVFYYAQLSEENICVGISQLSGIVDFDNAIRITAEEYSWDLIGCEYLGDGVWKEKEQAV